MRFDVPLVSAGLIGAATASWVPAPEGAYKRHDDKKPHIAPHWGFAQKQYDAPQGYAPEGTGSAGPTAPVVGSSTDAPVEPVETAPPAPVTVTETVDSTIYVCPTGAPFEPIVSTTVIPHVSTMTMSESVPVVTGEPPVDGQPQEDVTSTENIISYITTTSFETQITTLTSDAPVVPVPTDDESPEVPQETATPEVPADQDTTLTTTVAATETQRATESLTLVGTQSQAPSYPVVNGTQGEVIPTTSDAFYGTAPNEVTTSEQSAVVTSGTQVISTDDAVVETTASTAPAVTVSSVDDNSNVVSTSAVESSSVVASSTTASASASATADATNGDCSELCSNIEFSNPDVRAWTCSRVAANTETDTAEFQSSVGCAATFTPPVDICRVTMTIATSDQTTTYMEVFLPDGEEWNGRMMSSDNGGVNGCVHYVDMTYVLGKGFAVAGDNGGHNSSSFDGTAFNNNVDAVVDWSYRSRHAAAVAGKEVINSYYSNDYSYSYYLGCSTGGRQGLKSAQEFPNDFDGIIAGSSAGDFNNLEYWSGRFVQITGLDESNPSFLTLPQWELVHQANLDQCDEALDGVADGIIEDATLCFPTFESITCDQSDDENCLSSTQLETVNQVFSPALDPDGGLIFPRLQPGSEIDAWRLGTLSGSVQGIVQDWFQYAVLNDDSFNAVDLTYDDLLQARQMDAQNGYVSSYDSDLSALEASGSKLLMYHGQADPNISGLGSQRYYLDVARTMGYGYEQLDDFFRFFRISGQAHCSIGGVTGEGAWAIGQSGLASGGEGNVIDSLVDWVENDNAPTTILGTKFNDLNDKSAGFEIVRPHCRFPFRTTYTGGDASGPDAWDCVLIENWQSCDGSDGVRLC
ncbi:hypothetical protein MBLNU230_g3715t1 [Neophaeotheca triangularis]